jgi:hypothetical protein
VLSVVPERVLGVLLGMRVRATIRRDDVEDDATGSRPDGIRLDDIVDIEAIRRIAEDFHALTGHVLSIVDLDDRFLVRVGWTEACTRFHRANPE